jgi:rRNA pseudouridine-1189 N-methylase Emg1 (Nep1/Mra1 family)
MAVVYGLGFEHQRKNAGAMLQLFRKRIATADNLEALIRMTDSNLRTREIRC